MKQDSSLTDGGPRVRSAKVLEGSSSRGITAMQQAHRPSIEHLIDEHHAQVFQLCYRLTGSQADAEDVTQQTFLIAHQRLHQLREPGKAKSWLLVIARSCFLKATRRKRPTPEANLEIQVSELASYEPDQVDVDSELLQQAFNKLSDDHRLIVTMFYFEGLSYRQIASQLCIQIGTVMSRLARAKAQLRGCLLKSGGDRG